MSPLKFYTNSFDNGDENSLFAPWSFIHFGAGIIAGGIAADALMNNTSNIDTLSVVWLTLVILWEVFEYLGEYNNFDWWAFTYEHPINKLNDVALGLLGFTLLLFVAKVDVA